MDVRAIHPSEIEPARVLRAGRDGVAGFYERLAFRRSDVAIERPGRQGTS